MANYTDPRKQELARRDAALIARLNTLLADESTMARLRAELAATAESVRSRSEADQVFLWQQTADRGYPLRDVASYDDWQKRGRHVRRGSKALKVISPVHAVRTDADGICQVPSDARTKAALFDISDTQPLDGDQPAEVITQPHVDTRTEERAPTAVTSTQSPAVSIEAQALAGLLTQVNNAGSACFAKATPRTPSSAPAR